MISLPRASLQQNNRYKKKKQQTNVCKRVGMAGTIMLRGHQFVHSILHHYTLIHNNRINETYNSIRHYNDKYRN